MKAVMSMFNAAATGGIDAAIRAINADHNIIMAAWQKNPEMMYGYADAYMPGTGAVVKDAIAVVRASRTTDFTEALDILFAE